MAETAELGTERKPVLWLKDLAERWGVSDVTLWRLRRDRKIPAPTITLGKRVGWSVKVIQDFEAGRPDHVDQAPQPQSRANKGAAERRAVQ